MPTRSLTSSVLRWPSKNDVKVAARRWALAVTRRHSEIVRIGVFGSYARGDAGVGSDLDLVAIVREIGGHRELRAKALDTTRLPVPVDLLVYTEAELEKIRGRGRFGATLEGEVIWLCERSEELSA